MGTRRMARLGAAIATVALILSLTATAALAGEITGNGKVLKNADGTLNGQSECAFSGQEDLQFLDENDVPLETATKGEPAHAQSWGQIPKAVRDSFPAFQHPGIACNPVK